jgi:hypothetical protein
MLSRLTPTDVGTLCAFLTGREKCGLGLAEGLGKRGVFLDPHASKLCVKNGVEVRVDDYLGSDDAGRFGETLRSRHGQRPIQGVTQSYVPPATV